MLRKYRITGGRPLNGKVQIAGSKNAALPIFAATLLTDEEVILRNVPRLRDTDTMARLLENLGKAVTRTADTVVIKPQRKPGTAPIRATYEIVKQMRASISVLGPLLARHGHVEVSLPGGCVFGPRPVDLHLRGLAQLGADLTLRHGDIIASPHAKRLCGGKVELLGPFGTSVLATDNVLSAAVLADGASVLMHAAREPETLDLIGFLRTLGAKIDTTALAKHGRLTIEGVDKLGGGEYRIIPDRIEAGSWLCFIGLTGGKVTLTELNTEHLTLPLARLRASGFQYEETKAADGLSQLQVTAPLLADTTPLDITTGAYPGFPTDLQPLFMALATVFPGRSRFCERIYPNRFNHAPELTRMGAQITVTRDCAEVTGVTGLDGARVQASDLRAGAALVGAALAASGESELKRIYHIERGYENLLPKLRSLGANIEVFADPVL